MRAIDADTLKDYIDAQEGRPFIGCTVVAVEVAVGEEITGAITAVRKLIGANNETN